MSPSRLDETDVESEHPILRNDENYNDDARPHNERQYSAILKSGFFKAGWISKPLTFLRSIWTNEKIPIPRRSVGKSARISRYHRPASGCEPNMFTRPSDASKKDTVSTPSAVIGTSANDCIGSARLIAELVVTTEPTLTVSKYGAMGDTVTGMKVLGRG